MVKRQGVSPLQALPDDSLPRHRDAVALFWRDLVIVIVHIFFHADTAFRTMQRNPMWLIPVSIGLPCRDEHHLVIQPQPIKKAAGHIKPRFAACRWQPFFHDISDTAIPINSIKQRLLC